MNNFDSVITGAGRDDIKINPTLICPDDIDEKARCLCEDFGITKELCKECWDAFIREKLK